MPSYEEDLSEFERRNAQVLGISVDQVFSNEAWAKSMGGLSYPLLSDTWPYGYVCVQNGVLRGEGRRAGACPWWARRASSDTSTSTTSRSSRPPTRSWRRSTS